MNTYQFKTNINCSGCIAKVTSYLDGNKDISEWKVDTQNPQKILTVQTDQLSKEAVADLVKSAGYKAELI